MDEWRSKVLKDVQYVCKLAAWILAWQNGAKTPTPLSAEVTDRLKQGAAALSIARRIMMTGSWIEDYGDLVSACNSEGLRSWKGCTLLAKTASSLIDDVATAKKIGLIPPKKLPSSFDRVVDVLWTASVVMHLAFILVWLQRLGVSGKSYEHQRKVLWVSFAKFGCDLGQCLPAAALIDSPPLFDTLCGLSSGLLSTYKCWLDHQ